MILLGLAAEVVDWWDRTLTNHSNQSARLHTQTLVELTLSISGGSLSNGIDNRNTKAGAVEKSAVTSVGAIDMSARAYK